ncbi:MAG: hypothetical protein ACFFC7_27850 [Candidatus Hermodarchaeota archaeon]
MAKKHKTRSKMPSRERFIELCKECNSRKELRERLGVTRGTMNRYTKKLQVNRSDFFEGSELSEKEEWDLCVLYIQHNSTRTVAKLTPGVSQKRVSSVLKRKGFVVPKNTAGLLSDHIQGKYLILPCPESDEYLDAVKTIATLAKSELSSESEPEIAVQDYNKAIKTLLAVIPKVRKLKTPEHLQRLQLFFQYHSNRALRRLNMSRSITRDVLKTVGITLVGDRGLARDHIRGDYLLPLAGISSLIEGMLLGDGSVLMRSEANAKVPSFQEYQSARHTLNIMSEAPLETAQQVLAAVSKYNKAIEIIRATGTAHFQGGKSLMEEPWLRSIVVQKLQSHGYEVNISFNSKTQFIFFRTRSSVQLFYLRLDYYPDGIKTSFAFEKFTPESLLYFYVDDGSLGEKNITIASQAFSLAGNEHLLHCLNQIGITGTIRDVIDRRTKKLYHILAISKTHTQKFLDYLEQAPKDALTLAKQLFPWKFTLNLRKKDVIRDPDYILTFLDLLAHSLTGSEEDLSARAKHLLQRFPWNETLFHVSLY